MPPRRRRHIRAHAAYVAALASRFRITICLASGLFVVVPLLFWWLYPRVGGTPITWGAALHHVYFLLLGNPSLAYVDSVVLEMLNMAIPALGIAVIVDGLVRFTFLFFAKHSYDKEWISVMSKTLSGHVVVCGAGRVGYRVASQLLEMGREVIVVEKREDAAFVSVLRDLGIPVLIDDIKSPQCLPRVNVAKAEAIVCATDDDLSNLNVALDARRLRPNIRVVLRLFDDDLVAKVRESFQAEAFSSSALAAPAMALSALDPRIAHSFEIGTHRMVVSEFVAGERLASLTVAQIRDRFGGLTLSLRRADAERVHPPGDTAVERADRLMVQSEYQDYVRLREFTGELEPPLASNPTRRDTSPPAVHAS